MSSYEVLDIIINIVIAIITLVGIIGTIIYTNKNTILQINNQNKQSYRPYIRIDKIEVVTNNEPEDQYTNMFDQYYNDIYLGKNNSKTPVNAPIGIRIELKNIGFGIAKNVKIFDMKKCKELKIRIIKEEGAYIINNNSNYDLAISEIIPIKIVVKYIKEKKEISDFSNYAVFYEDINGNVYSNEIKMKIGINDDGTIKLSHENINSFDHQDKMIYDVPIKNSELDSYLKSKKLKS